MAEVSLESLEKPAGGDRLNTIVALLIALVTVIGALVAWRASVADDASGDADFAGLKASLNAEQTRALSFVNAYEHYGAYTNYVRQRELGRLLEQDQANADEETAERLALEMADAYDLAAASQQLFPNKFLSRDGSYSVDREMGEMWADASKEKDLNPDPQYAEADKYRSKSNRLLATIAVLGGSLVAYTLVEAVNRRLQYVLVGLGSVLALAGTVAALFIEFGM